MHRLTRTMLAQYAYKFSSRAAPKDIYTRMLKVNPILMLTYLELEIFVQASCLQSLLHPTSWQHPGIIF